MKCFGIFGIHGTKYFQMGSNTYEFGGSLALKSLGTTAIAHTYWIKMCKYSTKISKPLWTLYTSANLQAQTALHPSDSVIWFITISPAVIFGLYVTSSSNTQPTHPDRCKHESTALTNKQWPTSQLCWLQHDIGVYTNVALSIKT